MPMRVTVAMIAQLVQGDIEGDPQVEILGPAPIEAGTPGTISFLADAKYEAFAYQTESSALLVDRTFTPQQSIKATLIRVENVRWPSLLCSSNLIRVNLDRVSFRSKHLWIHLQ